MVEEHLSFPSTLEHFVRLGELIALPERSRLRLAELLPLVEHRAEALVFFPFAAEDLHECTLFIEARIFLKDGVVLELAQSYVLL